jgi:hypothetical protein
LLGVSVDHDKYVRRYLATDKNVWHPSGVPRHGCAFDRDAVGVPMDDSNIFVYVSSHIYKNVAHFRGAVPPDRPIS